MSDVSLFSRSQLRTMSTASSFERGESYYEEGSVGQVVQRGNVYECKVQGSAKYKVKLEMKGATLHFHCSCPYDYEGICKHAVALGLAILAHEYKADPAYKAIDEPATIQSTDSAPTFEALFEQVSQELKLDFLQILLNQNADLRGQFIQYTTSQATKEGSQSDLVAKPMTATASENIDVTRDRVYTELSEMDFDDLNYDLYEKNTDHYVERWEVDQQVAMAMIREVLDEFVQKATAYIRKGNLLDGLRIMLGMYEGISGLTEPASDGNYIFEGLDYKETVLEVFEDLLTEWVTLADGVIKSDAAVKQAIELLIERNLKYELEYNKQSDEPQILYDLKHFETLLLSLLTNPSIASHLLALLNRHQLIDNNTAYIVLKIAQLTQDEKLWFKTAEEFAGFERDITKQLLQKYHAKGNEHDFIRVAEMATKLYPNEFDAYLLEIIRPEANLPLYLKALESRTRSTLKLESYLELRKYWNKQQLNTFITSFANGYTYLFYVQLLAVEERYADILSFLQKKQALDYIADFDVMLTTIVAFYPQECFRMVVARSERQLMVLKGGRSAYQQIAKWIKALLLAEELKEEARSYALHLYNSQPILPALRDEFKKMGIVN